MITQCKVCRAPVQIGKGWSGICTRCGTKAEYDVVIYDYANKLTFPRYKIIYKFGKAYATNCSRQPDTKKQAKRRVAKRKKHNHKTGRFPRG